MEQTDNHSEMGNLQSHEVTHSAIPGDLAGKKTIICSVLFLDIVGYTRKSVSRQMELKNGLNIALDAAISLVPADARIILDTGDGAAISFLGDGEDALRVAMALRESLLEDASARFDQPFQVRMGINLGPVRLIMDSNGQPNIVGDGIYVAQRVMEFAEAGQILVSRSYYDAISNLSHIYAGLLHYHGKYTDKHVREHEVYSVSRPEDMGLLMPDADSEAEGSPHQDSGAKPGLIAKLSGKPAILIGGILVTVLLLVTANLIKTGLRDVRHEPSAESVPAQVATNVESGIPPPIAVTSEPETPEPASMARMPVEPTRKKPATPVQKATNTGTATEAAVMQGIKPAPAAQSETVEMATLSIAVTPWGEVYLDGKLRGVSPPLTEIAIKPGNHNIEIRNKTFPQYRQYFRISPGEKKEIRYKFTDNSK